MSDRLLSLHRNHGQSPWLDNLKREYLTSGHLQNLISQGIRGLTSNPTIFQKAIQQSTAYDTQFFSALSNGLSPREAYWELVIEDITQAAELFDDLFVQSNGLDGFVSVEVDPRLARDTQATIEAATELRQRIHKPNVMIKIPATREGLPAITHMVTQGCPVNVTLIFSLARYIEVMEAYVKGLEARLSQGDSIAGITGVASFFISRVDSEIDAALMQLEDAHHLLGRSAIHQARLAFELFENFFSTQRWLQFAEHGALVQRPLWASTSTKNPSYPDTLYVDELIGPMSVNTIPEPTLEAFIDHGNVASTLRHDRATSQLEWNQLMSLGIDVDAIAEGLENVGVSSFVDSFEDLMHTLETKAASS